MSHLVQHPWDGLGEPPGPGLVYPASDFKAELAKIDELVKEADGYYDEADEHLRDAHVVLGSRPCGSFRKRGAARWLCSSP